jgi:hypothetical protein
MSLLRCANCAYRSDLKTFFRREAVGNGWQTLCDACGPRSQNQKQVRIVLGLSLWGLIGALVLLGAFANSLLAGAVVSSTILGIIVGIPAAVALHETGHSVAAHLAGRWVALVLVGRGPRIWSARIGRGILEVRRNVWHGGRMIAVASTERPSRLAQAIMVLAGPVVNLVVADLMFRCVPLAAAGETAIGSVLAALLTGAGISQAFIGVANLFPFKSSDGVASDGLQIWRLLTDRVTAPPEHRWIAQATLLGRAGHADAAVDACLRAVEIAPENPVVLASTVHWLSRHGGDDAAVRWYEGRGSPLACADPSEEPTLVWLFVNLVWSVTKARRYDLAASAEQWLGSALAAAPTVPQVLATHGMWLVWRDNPQPGIETMRCALRQIVEPEDRADLCGLLATALRGHGDTRAAEAYDDLASRNAAAVYA